MGKRNYLIEGVSGTIKTSVCQELRQRDYAAINGDRELRLRYQNPLGDMSLWVSLQKWKNEAKIRSIHSPLFWYKEK
jgi:hypothetical protein